MSAWLASLSLSEGERDKLRALGVATPVALLSMRKASKAAFDNHLGPERAEAIAREAESLLTDEERARLADKPKPGGSLGARLDRPPDDGTPPG